MDANTNFPGRNCFGDAVSATVSKFAGSDPIGGAIWTGWTTELCQLDTDGDGLTNGQELCDADCDGVVDAGACTPTHPALPGDSTDLRDCGGPDLVKIHLSFMLAAWAVLAPAGILLVVIRKRKPGWFPYHRNIMSGTACLTVIGFIVIVIQSGIDSIGNNNHTKAGFVTVLLSVVQPISGFLRVHVYPGEEKSGKRLAWEAQHQWTGRFAMFAATFAMITGIEIYFGNESIGYVLAAVFGLVTATCFVYVICSRDREMYQNMTRKFQAKPKGLKEHAGSYQSTPPPAMASTPTFAQKDNASLTPEAAGQGRRTWNDFEV
uniref:Cytochrome b561 domain-containing protein n=1 Tax=Aplanochytrium stocchinoi TaxID=215587 RepID=A0A7S3V058_9STRA